MEQGTKTPIRAVRRAAAVLRALARRETAGVTELATELDLPKSTVHNYLVTLLEEEFVVRDGDDYRLGLGCLDLGGTVRDGTRLFEVAREPVDDLAQEVNELGVLAVEEHGYSVYLYQTGGTKAVTLDSHLGTRRPMHCTATGKSMLAHLRPERVETILERHGLDRRTENTITDRGTLLDDLAAIRERGYGVDDEELIVGMRAVAAPIVPEPGGELLGTIAVTGPTSRMHGDRFRTEVPELVTRFARLVEINAEYS
jgi:DNA-binding IclR family transcriptional regulator